MIEIVGANLRLGLVEFNATFFFTLANAVIMFLIMKHFLFAPLTKFMEGRKAEIKKQYDDAHEAEEKALAMKAEYETKIASAREEGEKIVKDYTTKADVKVAEMLENASAEADRYKEKAKRDMEEERAKATLELKDSFAELTVLAASKVLSKELDQKKHEELISGVLSEVGEVKWQM